MNFFVVAYLVATCNFLVFFCPDFLAKLGWFEDFITNLIVHDISKTPTVYVHLGGCEGVGCS